MRKFIIIIAIFLIILGIGAYIYFKVEPQTKEFVNVSIIAKYDEITTKTGIIIDGIEINTSKSYELILLEKKEIKIKNINLENQNFYEKEYIYNLTEDTRIDIDLEKPELPIIELKNNDGITLTMYSKNFEEVKFCIVSSLNYIFIDANQTKIKKLNGFENYDSCYDLQKSLENSKESIKINYSELSNPTETDYINVSIIDSQGNYITKRIK